MGAQLALKPVGIPDQNWNLILMNIKNMTKLPVNLALGLALSLVCTPALFAQSTKAAPDSGTELPKDGIDKNDSKAGADLPEGILALVNGRPIPQISLDTISAQLADKETQADPERILEELINMEVLTQEAEKLKLDEDPVIAAALQLQYTQTLANAWISRMSEEIEVTDEELQTEYDAQTANMAKAEFKASHILLENEEDAVAVIDELAKGTDFATLAKERSTDPAGPNGGDLGWFQRGAMVEEFTDAVENMEVGETSKAPVKSSFGYHVIQLVDKREASLPDFAAVKPGLTNLVVRNKLAKRVEEMRKSADIQR